MRAENAGVSRGREVSVLVPASSSVPGGSWISDLRLSICKWQLLNGQNMSKPVVAGLQSGASGGREPGLRRAA